MDGFFLGAEDAVGVDPVDDLADLAGAELGDRAFGADVRLGAALRLRGRRIGRCPRCRLDGLGGRFGFGGVDGGYG